MNVERPDRQTCEEIFRRLDDYLDRQLTPDEMLLVQRHLEACATCASQHKFEASVLQQVRSKLRRIDLPADLLGKIAHRIENESGGSSRG